VCVRDHPNHQRCEAIARLLEPCQLFKAHVLKDPLGLIERGGQARRSRGRQDPGSTAASRLACVAARLAVRIARAFTRFLREIRSLFVYACGLVLRTCFTCGRTFLAWPTDSPGPFFSSLRVLARVAPASPAGSELRGGFY
jgi:hypothetical protein